MGNTQPSIAVLAFEDLSPQKDEEYLCEGIAEEIINDLSKMEGIRVASRTSSFAYKGKSEDIRNIGPTTGCGLPRNSLMSATATICGRSISIVKWQISLTFNWKLPAVLLRR
jgi:hypothetical protein